jgi:DNA polymerase III subunit gamma/tau
MAFRLVARGEGDCKTRYRPQRLSEICPTFPMKEAKAILSDPHASQVYLVGGLTGCGKTTLARILARAVVCSCEDPKVEKPCLECPTCEKMESCPDYNEVNAAYFSGKDDTKRKIGGMSYVGTYFKGKKIYIFDEVHGLTGQAQELLLKVLEEPDPNTLIFLCTTHVKGLKRTLLGRCATINFKRLTLRQASSITKQICEDAGKEVPQAATIESLFLRADGSVRDLLNDIDKVILGTFEENAGFVADESTDGAPNLFKIVEAIKSKNWLAMRDVLMTENVKNEPEGYRQVICDTLRRQALQADNIDLGIAGALGHLSGSLADEPRNEQLNILVLRCMRACYKK